MTVSWPGASDPRDPFADCSPAVPFAAALADVWRGRRPFGSLVAEAHRLGLTGPLPPGTGIPARATRVPSDLDLARIAADQDPAIGSFAPDLVLGPWADEADRASLLAAMAQGAFIRSGVGELCPAARHLRADRRFGSEHGAIRPIQRAPLAPWRVRGDRLQPLLPIGAVPDGPVELRPIARPTGRDGVVFARVVLGPDGWVAVAPIAAPALPAATPVWVQLLAWEERLVEPCATLDELLARRGHALLRRALEDAW